MYRRGSAYLAAAVRRIAAQQAPGCTISVVRLASTAAAAASQTATSSSASATSIAALLAATAAAAAFSSPAWASTQQEKTFIMIKPDGVHRGLISDIIARFERKGYRLVGIKVLVPSADLAGQHYEEHRARPFFPKLVNFLSSGPVVAMVWEGKEAIKYGRTMIGATNPLASAPGTIRGDYGIDVGRNIIHGSDSLESAQREIALWFTPEELARYELNNSKWSYE